MMSKLGKILKLLRAISLVKTVYVNLKYFDLKTAAKFPVFIYKHTTLLRTKGKIVIDCPVTPGVISIGAKMLGTFDVRYSPSMWEVEGTLVVNGKVRIGQGSKISIGENAVLTFGRDFTITGQTAVICKERIDFGDDCLLSWDILIMDTDFHHILNENKEIVNAPSPVIVGNHVWIGCRNTILKGVRIADNSVIAAGSVITKSVIESNVVYGGAGKNQQVLKRNIDWKI